MVAASALVWIGQLRVGRLEGDRTRRARGVRLPSEAGRPAGEEGFLEGRGLAVPAGAVAAFSRGSEERQRLVAASAGENGLRHGVGGEAASPQALDHRHPEAADVVGVRRAVEGDGGVLVETPDHGCQLVRRRALGLVPAAGEILVEPHRGGEQRRRLLIFERRQRALHVGQRGGDGPRAPGRGGVVERQGRSAEVDLLLGLLEASEHAGGRRPAGGAGRLRRLQLAPCLRKFAFPPGSPLALAEQRLHPVEVRHPLAGGANLAQPSVRQGPDVAGGSAAARREHGIVARRELAPVQMAEVAPARTLEQ